MVNTRRGQCVLERVLTRDSNARLAWLSSFQASCPLRLLHLNLVWQLGDVVLAVVAELKRLIKETLWQLQHGF